VLGLLAVFVLGKGIFGTKGSGRTFRTTLASATVDLGGREITTIPARIEGPFVLVETKGGQQVVLSRLSGGEAETFTLIGIDGTVDAAPAQPGMPMDPGHAARLEMLHSTEPMTAEAIRTICGSKRLLLLRMTPASAGSPSKIYLFEPDSQTADANHPGGPALLINAELIREGKALLKLEKQPFLDPPMIDCELAAIVEARHSQEKGKPIDTIWTRFNPGKPEIPNYEERMERVRKTIP
jgi:hypothetical protein